MNAPVYQIGERVIARKEWAISHGDDPLSGRVTEYMAEVIDIRQNLDGHAGGDRYLCRAMPPVPNWLPSAWFYGAEELSPVGMEDVAKVLAL